MLFRSHHYETRAWVTCEETRNNTRPADLDDGRHTEPPKLRQISATSNGRSPARVRHVEGGPFCKKSTKYYWNRAILTALKARSNFQVRIELGFNISAGLKSRLNLVSKFKRPFVNSCQIQILITKTPSIIWSQCFCNIWIWQLLTKGRKFGEVLEALCAGRHPNLQALCYFLFLGGRHQRSRRNPSQNPTKSYQKAQLPLGKWTLFIWLHFGAFWGS